MNPEQIFVKLKNVLSTDFQVAPERITPEATFRGTLGMDSLDAVDLIYLLSKEFKIPADLHAYANLHSVKSVVDHVASQLAQSKVG